MTIPSRVTVDLRVCACSSGATPGGADNVDPSSLGPDAQVTPDEDSPAASRSSDLLRRLQVVMF